MRWVAVLLAAGLLAAAGCGPDAPVAPDREAEALERQADVLTTVVRAVVVEEGAAEPPVVFVVATEEEDTIPLEVQVEVVDRLAEEADVRFVDSAEEAIAVDRPGAPVRSQGVLVAVDPLVAEADREVVRAELYRAVGDVEAFRVVVHRQAGGWEAAPPTPVPPAVLPTAPRVSEPDPSL